MTGRPRQLVSTTCVASAAALAILASFGCDRTEPAPSPDATTTITAAPPTSPNPTTDAATATSADPPATAPDATPTTSPAETPATQPTSQSAARAARLKQLIIEASIPPDDPTKLRFGGLVAPKPAAWQWKPPENRFRLANFTVPAASGGTQGHLAVFIAGGDGPAIVRGWEKKFRTEDGEPAEAALSEMTVDGRRILIVELEGERLKTGNGWYTPGQRLLGAWLASPDGPVQIRLVGPAETVEANRDAFFALIQGIRRAPAPSDDTGSE